MTPEQNHQLEAAIADIVYNCVISPRESTVYPGTKEAFFDPLNQCRIRVRHNYEEFPEEKGYVTLFTGKDVSEMCRRTRDEVDLENYKEHPEELVADFYSFIYPNVAYRVKEIEDKLEKKDRTTKNKKGNTP